MDTLKNTVDWFKVIDKPSNIDNNRRDTQLGCLLEETLELVRVLYRTKHDSDIGDLIESLETVSDKLKNSKETIVGLITDKEDRIETADALGDIIVTIAGWANLQEIDIVGTLDEINKSNNSKFDKDGQPIYDSNRKVIKSTRYFRPKLDNFV